MEQFNLNEYISNPSRKLVTRDGRQVRIIEIGAEGDYPIVALIKAYDNSEVPHRYTKDGLITSYGECNLDLFFAYKKNEKFDPNTLKPYDKVLVRQNIFDFWLCDHFSFMNGNAACKFWCASYHWCYCIPYNDETKHLVGTTDNAPEYYRHWEE